MSEDKKFLTIKKLDLTIVNYVAMMCDYVGSENVYRRTVLLMVVV